LPVLNPNPPPFKPTDCYTLERRGELNKNHACNFLWLA
jgi:rRNA maturation protein Nop10